MVCAVKIASDRYAAELHSRLITALAVSEVLRSLSDPTCTGLNISMVTATCTNQSLFKFRIVGQTVLHDIANKMSFFWLKQMISYGRVLSTGAPSIISQYFSPLQVVTTLWLMIKIPVEDVNWIFTSRISLLCSIDSEALRVLKDLQDL